MIKYIADGIISAVMLWLVADYAASIYYEWSIILSLLVPVFCGWLMAFISRKIGVSRFKNKDGIFARRLVGGMLFVYVFLYTLDTINLFYVDLLHIFPTAPPRIEGEGVHIAFAIVEYLFSSMIFRIINMFRKKT